MKSRLQITALTLLVVLVVVASLILTKASDVPPPSQSLKADCAAPMVLVFDGSISQHATVGLMASASGVTIDWGGRGVASPVGATPAQESRVQTYEESPGDVHFTYSDQAKHTVLVCGVVTEFGITSTPGPKTDYLRALTEVVSFGEVGIKSLNSAFLDAENLSAVPQALPSSVTDL